jgi:hypothetical protein
MEHTKIRSLRKLRAAAVFVECSDTHCDLYIYLHARHEYIRYVRRKYINLVRRNERESSGSQFNKGSSTTTPVLIAHTNSL